VDITLRCFGPLREQRGVDGAEAVVVPDGCTVAEARALLVGGAPGAAALPVAYAVNAALVGPGHRLRPGDELALLPPVGGG